MSPVGWRLLALLWVFAVWCVVLAGLLILIGCGNGLISPIVPGSSALISQAGQKLQPRRLSLVRSSGVSSADEVFQSRLNMKLVFQALALSETIELTRLR